jgi:glycosyltransferase involved in cell wall biosynthesis
MKIIHVILNLGYGGAENMLVKLVNQDKDNQILIITLSDYSPLKVKIHNTNVSQVSGFPLRASKIISFFRLISLVRNFKPDIIQSWMYHSELIGLVLKFFNPKAKLFWNIRCSTSEWLKLRFRNKVIFRLLISGSGHVSGIIVNSHVEFEESILLGYPKEKLIYIPNGFENVEIANRPFIRNSLLTRFNITGNAIIIGCVSKNSVLKDIDTLLKAFQITNIKMPDTHLILVGSGFDDMFCDKLRNMGLRDTVHIYGTTNNIYEIKP